MHSLDTNVNNKMNGIIFKINERLFVRVILLQFHLHFRKRKKKWETNFRKLVVENRVVNLEDQIRLNFVKSGSRFLKLSFLFWCQGLLDDISNTILAQDARDGQENGMFHSVNTLETNKFVQFQVKTKFNY